MARKVESLDTLVSLSFLESLGSWESLSFLESLGFLEYLLSLCCFFFLFFLALLEDSDFWVEVGALKALELSSQSTTPCV